MSEPEPTPEQAAALEAITEAEGIDAARMMESGGASNVTVERTIVRVVQDVEPVE